MSLSAGEETRHGAVKGSATALVAVVLTLNRLGQAFTEVLQP